MYKSLLLVLVLILLEKTFWQYKTARKPKLNFCKYNFLVETKMFIECTSGVDEVIFFFFVRLEFWDFFRMVNFLELRHLKGCRCLVN